MLSREIGRALFFGVTLLKGHQMSNPLRESAETLVLDSPKQNMVRDAWRLAHSLREQTAALVARLRHE
jgi:hypothetical protein